MQCFCVARVQTKEGWKHLWTKLELRVHNEASCAWRRWEPPMCIVSSWACSTRSCASCGIKVVQKGIPMHTLSHTQLSISCVRIRPPPIRCNGALYSPCLHGTCVHVGSEGPRTNTPSHSSASTWRVLRPPLGSFAIALATHTCCMWSGIGAKSPKQPKMKVQQVSHTRFWQAVKDVDPKTAALVLFTSGNNPDGQPWCPDCRRIDPLVRTAAAARDAALLEVQVGDVKEWKEVNQKHPLKQDPRLELKSVPTLCRWEGGKKGKCVELEQYRSETEVLEALEQFFETST